MGRLWSLLFLMVPVFGVATFIVAPRYDHWLPLNVNDFGYVIDELFMFILVLTGAIFIGTGLALFWFLWKYDAEQNAEAAVFTHGSHTLEVVWSVLPAAILMFIAFYQMNAWADARMRRPLGVDDQPLPPLARVVGRQFEWRIQYAGEDGELFTPDDVHVVNELRVPVNEDVVLQIEAEDVLHSFFLPNLRIKQDVIPGMQQFVWFRANRTGLYDIVCAELCGWGHYKMRGRLLIESRRDFDRWLAEQRAEQERSEYSR